VLSTSIFRIFSESDNQFFIDYGSQAFRVIAFGFLLVGFQVIVSAVFQAFGYPLRALIITLSRQVMFFIPLAFLFSHFWGIEGIWYAFASADILSGIMSIALLVIEMKAINKLAIYSL